MFGKAPELPIFLVLTDLEMQALFICVINLPDSKIFVIFLVLSKTTNDIEPKHDLSAKLMSENFCQMH